MKKISSWILTIFFIIGFANVAFASSNTLNNYYGYRIYNQNYNDVNAKLLQYSASANIRSKTFPQIKYGYFHTKNSSAHSFIKIYPANRNTDIFIVADIKYDKSNNPMIKFFNASSYEYGKLSDKDALNEYKHDFIAYARKGMFNGLAVLPDCLQPVKKQVNKLSANKNKKDTKKAALPYKNESVNTNLTLLNTRIYKNEEYKISIVEREYRLKYKENKYTHAFSYGIYNLDSAPVVLKKVKGESIANLIDVEATTLVDFDKVDVMCWVGTFPPLIFLKIPAWYRNFKVAEETTRYAKSLPENYTIPASGYINMFIMKYKYNPKPLNFTFVKNAESFDLKF